MKAHAPAGTCSLAYSFPFFPTPPPKLNCFSWKDNSIFWPDLWNFTTYGYIRDNTKSQDPFQPYFFFAHHLSTAGLAKDCRVGLGWHFRCGCSNPKPRPLLDFSSKNQGSFFIYLFEKSKKYVSEFASYDRRTSLCLRAFEVSSKIIRSYYVVIACTLHSISIDLNWHFFDERDRFSSKKTAVGLSKKIFCRETGALQKHLRPPY